MMADETPPPIVSAILARLLDQAEQPERQRTPRVGLSEEEHGSYFSTESGEPRRQANIALRTLEQQGMVRLKWRRWEEGNWLAAVYLVPEGRDTLYALLGRVPRTERGALFAELLGAQAPGANWHARLLAAMRERLAGRRSIAPFDLLDPGGNADLMRLVGAIAALEVPVLERTLSVRLFGDSKRAEKLRRGVLAILREFSIGADGRDRDDWSILRAHFVDRVPEHILLAGPLVLSLRGNPVDIGVFIPSMGLAAPTIREATVLACAATTIITVENLTSFTELLAVRPQSALAVYTGGYPSPMVLALLKAIRGLRGDIPIRHWGDLDAGGLLILAHLRRHLGTVIPVGMDDATFEAHGAHSKPLTPSDEATVVRLGAEAILADCHPLIDHLLATRRKLEQEAVSAHHIAKVLACHG